MLILGLNCEAALANLSTRACISVVLCDTRALSSANNNSLMTIRLVLVLAFNCLTLKRLASGPPSFDVYSFRGVFEGHIQHRCQVNGEQCGRQHATLFHAIGDLKPFRTSVAHSDTGLHAIVKGLYYCYKLIGAAILPEGVESNQYITGIFVDLKKAFDTVNHQILIDKLNFYGIRGIPLAWLTSYLDNRQQYVMVNGHVSSNNTVVCGVLQGSVIDPFLLLLYINDIFIRQSIFHLFS